ncbi:DUF4175 family protein [Flammeovirga kamogawensis]|uniref:DUF4175 family protein n=1 Tax=Flammeovirga kamogawensis TaxID=373891 RepID=A0ABX8GTB1_9BACT|nr:DUF4175 family protein [Flammeovirga kamogawensis]MBB6463813.1 hypothetical protein [Flammeovirga kamogawensis]QWG06170.1 DUF4175 family protein [Flammeovirga kamogawensis]TRX68001.1 DUF4175 family protein [Flammeovirga kamogawensis]
MFESKIKAYKQKLYRNAAIKGAILTLAAVLGLFLLFSVLEYLNNFGTTTRAILFFAYIMSFSYIFFLWVIKPLAKMNGISKQISDEQAAIEIGNHFPEISDKLINSIQLQSEAKSNSLIKATLEQRGHQFSPINFTTAISYKENLRYWYRYLLPALVVLFAILFVRPQIIVESTPKIIQFDKEFLPIAPFTFNLLTSNLEPFQGDDFELKVALNGDVLPSDVYIETDKGSLIKLQKSNPGYSFVHTFKKIQHGVKFRFKAAGYYSKEFKINTLTRPNLSKFSVQVTYPRYTNKPNETLENTGNLLVPEGSNITWLFDTKTTDSIQLYFKEVALKADAETLENNVFKYAYKTNESTSYSVTLSNIYGTNKDSISYFLNVIKDKYPSISMRQYQDTVMFDYLVFGGNIGDDYGITRLRTRYRIKKKEDTKPPTTFNKIDIPFNRKAIDQSFYYKLETNQFNLKEGDKLEYFVEVYDNDGVNGNKRSKTPMYTFMLPTSAEIEKDLEESKKETENKLEETLAKADELNKNLKKLEEKLKGKRQLTWQDKKDIQKLIEERKALQQELENLQQQSQELKDKQSKFSEQDKSVAQKAEQLQKIIENINDEETQKLYDELQKLMEQNYINQPLQENLKNIEKKQKNLKNELERTIKLFKKLQIEQKAKEVSSKLEDLSQKQQEVAKETDELQKKQEQEAEDPSKKAENDKVKEDLVKKQEELNEKFEKIKQEMEELRKMDKKEQTNQDFEQFTPSERSIQKEQQNASEQLKQDKKKDAHQSQKKAANKMQQMAKQMQQSMQSAEMEQISEDHDALRQIMENLLKLSFDQEDLMESFKKVRRIDPKFVELSQTQLKLRDDAKYIEDSLVALSKRVFQIESFVTREVTDMNKYMDESLNAIKRRVPEVAASKQQFTMTSINNLTLLLSDILDNMQQQMSQSMAGQQMNQKQSSSSPSPSQMQQQLNQQMENLKKSGKSGKELSKELAKLAAQQEMIRNALKQSMGSGPEQMQGQKKDGQDGEGIKEGGNGYGKILKEMEKTEDDLVNKELTDKLIKRQKEILTRMLESEKAKKEKGKDEERKAETAKKQRQIPPPDSFDEYLKQKETQIELLRTIPTSLNTYYKQEVNKYFEKIKD